MLTDGHGRVHRDLRVSLTDRCNLRCTYCMPAEGMPWLPTPDLLTTDELLRVIEVAVAAGITEVRLTGGEPLLRPDVVDVVRGVAAMSGEHGPVEVSLTSNALRLPKLAQPLADAGLARVNISLDTLRADRFASMTRRDRFEDTMAGIAAADAAGLAPIKINTVLMRGVNDDEAGDLLRWALDHGYELRFIEQMPLDGGHVAALGDDHRCRDPRVAARGLRPRRDARSRGGPGRALRRRRRPRHGRDHRVGHDALLRGVRPAAPHRRRPAALVPLRPRRDRPEDPLRDGSSEEEVTALLHSCLAGKRPVTASTSPASSSRRAR